MSKKRAYHEISGGNSTTPHAAKNKRLQVEAQKEEALEVIPEEHQVGAKVLKGLSKETSNLVSRILMKRNKHVANVIVEPSLPQALEKEQQPEESPAYSR